MIAKYMTAKNTTKYVDKIDDLLDAYNTTPHSSLGDYSPNQVVENDKAYRLVNKINLAKMKYNNERTRKVTNSIKIGDVVRIKLKKKAFQKGYEITYSKETFEVREIDGDKALLTDGKKYKIEDLQIVTDIGNPIETTEKDADDRAAKINRRLKKSGIFD